MTVYLGPPGPRINGVGGPGAARSVQGSHAFFAGRTAQTADFIEVSIR
jgi:hypothetical protein